MKLALVSIALIGFAGCYRSSVYMADGDSETLVTQTENADTAFTASFGSETDPAVDPDLDGKFDAVPRTISATGDHTCAVLKDGRVACWGGPYSNIPKVIPGISNAVAVALSEDYGSGISRSFNPDFALLANGSVISWRGDLAETPQTVLNISNAVSLSVGMAHACAVISNGTIKCWGNNDFGQLGDGSTENADAEAVNVMGIFTAAAVGAGMTHTCAALKDGRV